MDSGALSDDETQHVKPFSCSVLRCGVQDEGFLPVVLLQRPHSSPCGLVPPHLPTSGQEVKIVIITLREHEEILRDQNLTMFVVLREKQPKVLVATCEGQ